METYADTGLVRYEYRHYAFLGEESVRAAEASECANELGQFWQYHDTLFANQLGENLGAFSDDSLRNFAIALGLDESAFNACFNSGRYRSQILADRRQGDELGVGSTPTFRINGEIIERLSSFEELQAIISSEVSASQ